MPVYILQRDMPYDELSGWISYFSRRPVGWREDLRVFKLMQSWGLKEKPEAVFDSLRAIQKDPNQLEEGQISVKSLKNSAFFSKMLNSVGGDRVTLDE